MSIIVPSSHHTRIGAWVNSKMYGRNPVVYLARIPHKYKIREAWVTTQFVTLHLGSDGFH